jgi:hypothetical protein
LQQEAEEGKMEDMQEYLARMNKQLAEMEAQHQQVNSVQGYTFLQRLLCSSGGLKIFLVKV